MGIADEFKTMSEDILTSHDSRTKMLGVLTGSVHKTLKGFAADRKQMGKEQAENSAGFVNDLTKKVAAMLKGFKTSHNEMSATLSKSLSDFVKDLVKDVGAMMGAITRAHKEMADDLKESLKNGETDRLKGETDRLKDFKAMMDNIQKGNADIENYVAKMLKEFSAAHADMSAALKKDLTKYVADIVSETKKLLGSFTDEREKMAANWQTLTATMARKRSGKPVSEAKEVVSKVKELFKKKEKVPETVKMDVAERVLEFINKHPKGIHVSDMEEPLGITRIKLGQVAKNLLDENRVRKEENLYFPL